MIPTSSVPSQHLTFSKIPWKQDYELKRDGQTVGSLRRTNYWTTECLAETNHGSWRFRRAGCLHTGAEIVDSTSGERTAVLKGDWRGGGRLTFLDGQTFHITSRGFWRPVWSVLADATQPVLSLDPCKKTVEIVSKPSFPQDKVVFLALFAWHLLKKAEEDAAAVAAVVAVTTVLAV